MPADDPRSSHRRTRPTVRVRRARPPRDACQTLTGPVRHAHRAPDVRTKNLPIPDSVVRVVAERVIPGGDPDISRRHDGGNRVLVDHLADAVFQQHYELVERLDLALQLDAIHEVNGHRYLLSPQGVEERVLKRLPSGHWMHSPVGPIWLFSVLSSPPGRKRARA